MIPLPPAELTVVKAPINDKGALGDKIKTALSHALEKVCIESDWKILVKPSALLLDGERRGTYLLTVRVLIEILQERGADVFVGDSPHAMLLPTCQYWRDSGLLELTEQTGCELFNFEAAKSSAVIVESRVYYLPESLPEFDLIINAAWLGLENEHEPAGIIQNCLGFLPGRQIEAWDKAAAAADLYALVSPQLNLLQFVSQGESYIIFGRDGVAVDSVVMSRLRGKQRAKSLDLAIDAGLGIGYEEMITFHGAKLPDSISPELYPFRRQPGKSSFLERIVPINVLKKKRVVVGDICDGCSRCCEVCPTGSISMLECQTPIWNTALCIECWRCREQCPSNAITVDNFRSAP